VPLTKPVAVLEPCDRSRYKRAVIWKVFRLALGLAALATAAACSRSIGDECATSVDCSPSGDRSCDLSQPGGYCTVEGCDARSCPEDSVCIRWFPEKFLTLVCDPKCEDTRDPNVEAECAAKSPQDPKATDKCTPDELCLSVGKCARRSFERRTCVLTCGDNSDCRGGYECRMAGTRGSMPLLPNPNGTAKFCAPVDN
jgi:hypothetical protein